MSHEHHHHEAAAAAPAKKASVELSAEDKHFKPEVVSWKELNKHERKAVAHYAVGKGGASIPAPCSLARSSLPAALAVFPFVAATFAWNASFYTKVAQTPQAKVMQAGGALPLASPRLPAHAPPQSPLSALRSPPICCTSA